MRFELATSLARVGLNDVGGVETVYPLERICGDKHDTGVCVDVELAVSHANGVQHGRFVEIRQTGEILGGFQNRRVPQWRKRVAISLDISHGGFEGDLLGTVSRDLKMGRSTYSLILDVEHERDLVTVDILLADNSTDPSFLVVFDPAAATKVST